MRDRSQNSDLLLERLMESTGDCEIENQTKWIEVQNELKQRLIAADDFTWKLPKHESEAAADGNDEKKEVLKYVGGVDVSYCKDDPSLACAALVVLILPTLQVVHQEYSLVRLGVPYIPGFLAFREAPVLLQLLEKVKANSPHFYPQLIFVDGNGILHPQGFGLACHLGVLADCPTIGIGKNLHHMDGLTLNNVKQLLGAKPDLNLVTLTGSSGIIWGASYLYCIVGFEIFAEIYEAYVHINWTPHITGYCHHNCSNDLQIPNTRANPTGRYKITRVLAEASTCLLNLFNHAQALASRSHCSSTSPRLRELNKSRKIVAVSKGLVGGSIPRFSPSYEPPIHDPPLP
ncbi:hypothetical protein SAY86_017164 [Trapa natans]|uniref:Endonuclease V n=1 Tax=Trapa natans TaxID=22666 RepID=A0AAN7R679_TRANT|nr:hypothetical protein SAY86_017164 [Trapa natans]